MPNPHFRINRVGRGDGQSVVASGAYRAAETLYDYGKAAEHAPASWSPAMLEAAARRAAHIEQLRAELEPARQKGRSVVEAAAYRAGGELDDERTRKVHSYSRKEGVLHSEIFAPGGAPEWVQDRGRLWNEVEAAEDKSTRWKTARLAYDFAASVPRELPHAESWAFVSAFVRENFTAYGLVADVSFHEVKARDGGTNPHVHIMVTTRPIGPDGFGVKARWLDDKAMFEHWRGSWERHQNGALEATGRPERVSMQSYRTRGIDREATKPLGYKASALEKKGVRTRQGDENREIVRRNEARKLHEPAKDVRVMANDENRRSVSDIAAQLEIPEQQASEIQTRGDYMMAQGVGQIQDVTSNDVTAPHWSIRNTPDTGGSSDSPPPDRGRPPGPPPPPPAASAAANSIDEPEPYISTDAVSRSTLGPSTDIENNLTPDTLADVESIGVSLHKSGVTNSQSQSATLNQNQSTGPEHGR